MDKNFLDLLEDIISKINTERTVLQPKDLEGAENIYSLICRLEELCSNNQFLYSATIQVKFILEEEKGNPLSDFSLALIEEFLVWLQVSVNFLKEGNELASTFVPSLAHSKTKAPKPPSSEESISELDSPITVDFNLSAEMISDFNSESNEHIEIIERFLLTLENNPQDIESLEALFRSFHTLKGVASLLYFTPIAKLAHEIESLLELARQGKMILDHFTISLILQSHDAIKLLIQEILEAFSTQTPSTKIIPIANIILDIRKLSQTTLNKNLEIDVDSSFTKKTKQPREELTPTKIKKPPLSTVRVNTVKLDNLLDAVGELVVIQSQLQENAPASESKHSHFSKNLAQLKRITKDLQNTSTSLRMVPIKSTFQKISRVVRETSHLLNKKVNISIKGEDTELDRTIIEKINDPLIHMVRNAIDHGIESPEERLRKGKNETGTCRLNAYHLGGNIVIEIEDDGCGLDHEKIFATALEKNLISEDQNLTQQEIYNLIFMPAFSTVTEVNDISGRGVGMDVVRNNIQKLRGKISIESTLDKGTSFKFIIPLTMAIIEGLIFQSSGEKYILPASSVQASLIPYPEQISTIQGKTEVLTLKNRTIPLIRLDLCFDTPLKANPSENGIIIIVETISTTYGLFVDKLISKQEVVIKNLGNILKDTLGIAGGAILGNGSIALILDPETLPELQHN